MIKNAEDGQFRRVFENMNLAVEQCYQTKIGGKWDIFCDFQTKVNLKDETYYGVYENEGNKVYERIKKFRTRNQLPFFLQLENAFLAFHISFDTLFSLRNCVAKKLERFIRNVKISRKLSFCNMTNLGHFWRENSK